MKLRLILALITGLAIAATLTGCLLTPGPRAEISATPEYGYPPLEVQFDGSGSSSPDGIITDYHWEFGDGETADGANVSHSYTDKGVYRVTLAVTDSNGAVGSDAINVEALNRAPIPSFTRSSYKILKDQVVTFDATESYDPDGTIVEYRWNFGDGTTAVGQVVQHVYTTAQGSGYKATIVLTVTDDDGDANSKTVYADIIGCDSCG
ncbi:PKD domain-containing protein [Candidatus Bipolaricaulota bacterium]|nr:PKD domain-containing protein [Candidatus Bipolaricaulota bacterium]